MARTPDNKITELLNDFYAGNGEEQYREVLAGEKPDLAKAVELKLITDEVRKKIEGAGLEGLSEEFKAYANRKAKNEGRENAPVLSDKIAAFRAVYGMARWESKTRSEEKVDGKPSSLMKALARVLRFGDGLEATSLDGRDELRVAAVALDDAVAEREGAVARAGTIDADIDKAKEELSEARSKGIQISEIESSVKNLLQDQHFDREEFIRYAGQVGRIEDRENQYNGYFDEITRFQELIEDADGIAHGYQAIHAVFGQLRRGMVLEPGASEAEIREWQNLLNSDVVRAIKFLEEQPLMQTKSTTGVAFQQKVKDLKELADKLYWDSGILENPTEDFAENYVQRYEDTNDLAKWQNQLDIATGLAQHEGFRGISDELKVNADEFLKAREDYLKFVSPTTEQTVEFSRRLFEFTTHIDREFGAGLEAAKSAINAAKERVAELGKEKERVTELVGKGDPLQSLLTSAFDGLSFENGKITLCGFEGNLKHVFKKLDDAQKWLDDEKNVGDLRSSLADLKSRRDKVNSKEFRRKLFALSGEGPEEKIEVVLKGGEGPDAQEVDVEATLKRLEAVIEGNLLVQKSTKGKLDDAQKRKLRELGARTKQLQDIQKDLQKLFEVSKNTYDKMDTLMTHLGVAKTGRIKDLEGLASFEPALAEFKKASGDDPDSVLVSYEKLDGYLENDGNVSSLVGKFKEVRGKIQESSNLSDVAAAKKLLQAVLRSEFGKGKLTIPEENDLSTAVLVDGMAAIKDRRGLLEWAKELNPKAMENMQGLFIKEKLIGFSLKKGEKDYKPFEKAKVEDFNSWTGLKKYLGEMERAKGAKWTFEHAFYILGAFEHFEGDSAHPVNVATQRSELEKYLKNKLAGRRLGAHPEFSTVEDAMATSGFRGLIEEEYEEMRVHGRAKFNEFSDEYDSEGAPTLARKTMRLQREL